VFPLFHPHEGATVSLVIIRRMKLFRIERTMKWKKQLLCPFPGLPPNGLTGDEKKLSMYFQSLQ
jgi:hypothetical protein